MTLLERYGDVLTGHQREVLDLILRQDWSLAEVSERLGVSRAAVHDTFSRALTVLEDHERHFGLLRDDQRRRQQRETIRKELADLRNRIARLEARLADV